jgi:signal peptidase II
MIWIVMIVTVIVDQLSKYYVSHTFQYLESVTVVPKLFKLTYVHNYGAAFGILQHQRWLFIVVSVLVIGLVLYFYRQLPKDWLTKLAIGLVLGGTIGNNLLDRLRLGYVVDFFELPYWPVFNVADSAIVVGMIIIAWKIVFTGQNTGEIEDV